MSANNSGDDSEGTTNSTQHSDEISGDNNYSENDDVITDSDTKSAHSSYSNSATYSDVVVINRIDNVIVNEKHLIDHIDHNIDDNSIRKPHPFRKTCCKSVGDHTTIFLFCSFHLFAFFRSIVFIFHFLFSISFFNFSL